MHLSLFEKFALQPILTPGETNYTELLLPVVGAAWKRAVPTSFQASSASGAACRANPDKTRLGAESVHRRDILDV
jgi:hypothetical protein